VSGWDRFYAVVARIPRGRVATYGQVARLAGRPRHARQVGYALAALPADRDVPWQRVINARGEISRRAEPRHEVIQRELLRREGVRFGKEGRIDLGRFGWEPDTSGRAPVRVSRNAKARAGSRSTPPRRAHRVASSAR
jgi:methylated-DNA-protein-cysteine methyltransferase-like protein